VTGGDIEATGTPQHTGEPGDDAFDLTALTDLETPEAPTSAVDGTRFAHASEAEMARILDFYAVKWEYEPTTFPILWNLDGEVVESFAPDFYLPELEMFLEMTTLKQRLVRKKNRKLRRLRELYPGIRIKLFYARDFRAMMLKYGRLALAEALSGTPGQVVPERPVAGQPIEPLGSPDEAGVDSAVPAALTAPTEPVGTPIVAAASLAATIEPPLGTAISRAKPRVRSGRRRRRAAVRSTTETGAEREAGA
jgi:hypothetical protein